MDRSSGSCEECGATSLVPILLVCCLTLLGFTAMAFYARVDVSRIKLNTLAVGICMGQTAVAVQALAVFKVLEVDWVEPIRSFLNVISVLSFDLDVLALSCMFPDSNVLGKYILKMFIFPTGVLILCAIFFVMNKVSKQKIGVDHIVNSIGLLFLVLFLTLAMLSLAPFHCVSSPNGTLSLASNPSVICFDNSDWTMLAAFGAVAVLCYVVLFISWVTYVTVRYPKLISSGDGMIVINRYRFLFQRFTVECYFFTPIYLARNFIIAILPVVFPDYGHRQVSMLALVLLLFGFSQGWLRPWRGFMPNLLDSITTCCLIMALVGAALLNKADHDQVILDMQVFFTVLIVIVTLSTAGFVGFMTWRRFFPPKLFAAFLCHHKLGCAVGARLMKLELEQRLKRPVFLDSDALDNLEDLLDIVRTSISNLVVLLTAETLSRPWCAGEIATSYKNGVPIVLVSYDEYRELTEDDLSEVSISARWTPEAFAGCVTQGVSIAVVAEAYAWVRQADKIPCPRVSACMSGKPEEAMLAVERVVSACLQRKLARESQHSTSSKATTYESSQSECSHQSTTKAIDFATLANYLDGESISAARVLSRLVRAKTQWNTKELLHPREVQDAKDNIHGVSCLCVILTQGCLTSEGFLSTLLAALDAWGSDMAMVTIKMTGFEFPTNQMTKESVVPQVSKLVSKSEEEIAVVYQQLLSILSIPFSPHGHISVIGVEVDSILRRVDSAQKEFNQRTGSRKMTKMGSIISSQALAPLEDNARSRSEDRVPPLKMPNAVVEGVHSSTGDNIICKQNGEELVCN
jgi:hypothetical protein